uniref:Uncharacterized protein n=1 Tax=Opuntia streptacantha TaxID=393608 RepID=A0A7C8ZMW3_OPUST
MKVHGEQADPPATPAPAAVHLGGSTGPIGLLAKSSPSSSSLSDNKSEGLDLFLSTSLNVASKAALAAAAFSASLFSFASSACFIHTGRATAAFRSAINPAPKTKN